MRLLIVLGLAVMVVTLSAGLASAAPNYVGQTGLAILPTGEVSKVGDIAIGGHILNEEEDVLEAKTTGYHLTYGVTDALEINLAQAKVEDEWAGIDLASIDGLLYGLKYQLVAENAKSPAVAIGGSKVKLDGDILGLDYSVDVTSLYLAITKTLGTKTPVKGTIGVMRNDYGIEFLGIDLGDEDYTKVYAGLEIPVTEGLCVTAEYKAKEGEAKAIQAYGIRYQAAAGLNIDVGIGNPNGLDDPKVYYGLSYNIAAK